MGELEPLPRPPALEKERWGTSAPHPLYLGNQSQDVWWRFQNETPPGESPLKKLNLIVAAAGRISLSQENSRTWMSCAVITTGKAEACEKHY